MGNLIASAQGESADIGVWDMITYLVKRYIVSKVENDEFLCQYLLNNNKPISMLQCSQRAITFEPLPSRVRNSPQTVRSRKDYHSRPETSFREYDTSPQIVEYISEESSEESEEYESDEYESDEPERDQELTLYSAYEAVSQRQ